MTEWWSELSLTLQIFYFIGIISLVITIIQTILTLIGLGGEAADLSVDLDVPDSGHSSGIGLFSIQTISAFFMGFSWSGIIFIKMGLHIALSVFFAFNIGGIAMAAMYGLIVGMLSLQSNGNRRYATAVGTTAEVYITIPEKGKGHGQISAMIGGHLTTVDALSAVDSVLLPGQTVRILSLVGESSFIVEPIEI